MDFFKAYIKKMIEEVIKEEMGTNEEEQPKEGESHINSEEEPFSESSKNEKDQEEPKKVETPKKGSNVPKESSFGLTIDKVAQMNEKQVNENWEQIRGLLEAQRGK